MKKVFVTFGLLSLVITLTSFATTVDHVGQGGAGKNVRLHHTDQIKIGTNLRLDHVGQGGAGKNVRLHYKDQSNIQFTLK